MHPLITNLDQLKETELENKIAELTKRYYFSANNTYLQNQVLLVLDTYRTELESRRFAEWQKMVESQEKMIDKLINVD